MALVVKNPPANAGDARDAHSIPGSGRSPEGGNGNPLQYPCFENPMDRGAWQATVHEVAKSRTRLSTHAIANLIKNIDDIIFNHSTASNLLTILLIVNSYL